MTTKPLVLCNSVIASEEYKAPYVAIVKSGIACVLKQINVAIHMPGGKKVGSSLSAFNGKQSEIECLLKLKDCSRPCFLSSDSRVLLILKKFVE